VRLACPTRFGNSGSVPDAYATFASHTIDMLATARHPIARLSNPNETDSPMQSVFQLVGRHAAVYLGPPVCFLAIAIPTAYRDHTMGQKAKAFRPRNHRPHNFPCMSSSLQSHSTANSWIGDEIERRSLWIGRLTPPEPEHISSRSCLDFFSPPR
jgi:hypothetical protein